MRKLQLVAPAAVAAVFAGLASGAAADVPIHNSASPAASTAPTVGAVASSTPIDFEVSLKLANQSGAESLAQSVSTPGNAQYGKFLTPAQWEQRFSPSQASVNQVVNFLKQQGFTNIQASDDRLAVDATGTAAQIDQAFSTSMSYHRVHGQRLRLLDRNLSVPSSIVSSIAAVTGITETVATPQTKLSRRSDPETGAPLAQGGQGKGHGGGGKGSSGPIPQPPGFRVAQPCGAFYNDQIDTTLPDYGNGYPADPPWAVCGYTPRQLRSAYGLTNNGDNGSGVTVAIVDAYASPTIFSDAQHYAQLNDSSNPLTRKQFSQITASGFDKVDLCDASGWFGEETLDVEAVHTSAPGANILYSGAKNCLTPALNEALRRVIDHHLANIVTNSYGDDGGDVLDSAGDRASTDAILLMAAGTGVSVMFSSGDDGDEFTTIGQVAADYPSSSPWATAAGGTTLQIGSADQRLGEFGWSTARSFLCNQTMVDEGGCTSDQLNTWLPVDLALDGGSGGGTSVSYAQPPYQRGVVPNALSELNGPTPMRVEPDVAMDADPATGFLEGETQTFPDGVYYDQYRIGGTSLASPLFAGVVARADQAAGHPLGFLNPALYAMYQKTGAYDDIGPAGQQDQSRADFANSIDDSDGYLFSTRLIDYEGAEQFCDANNNCSTRNVALNTATGYDNMTGLGSPGTGFVADLAGH